MNLAGFGTGLVIACMSLVGFRMTSSPSLFRLTIAFASIGFGFLLTWIAATDYTGPDHGGILNMLGILSQTIGYFFIAFSHIIKTFMSNTAHLRSIGIMPLFLVSSMQFEHLFRSVSFMLLAYVTIETALSYMATRNNGALMVAVGWGLLVCGEFLGWYSLLFPGTTLYAISLAIKIAGLASLVVPITRILLSNIKSSSNISSTLKKE